MCKAKQINPSAELLDVVKNIVASRKEKAEKVVQLFSNAPDKEKRQLKEFMMEDVDEIIKDTYRQPIDFLTPEEQLVLAGYIYGRDV